MPTERSRQAENHDLSISGLSFPLSVSRKELDHDCAPPFRLQRRRSQCRTESRIVRVADGEPVTAWAAERPGLIVAIDVGRALVRWALVRGLEHVLARVAP